MSPFEEIWNRIVALAGQTFYTKTGLEFSYEICGNTFSPSRTKYRIAKSDFEKAYQLVPIDGPGAIRNIVRGSAFIWAVLHDQRISGGEW